MKVPVLTSPDDKWKTNLNTVNVSNIFVTKVGHMADRPNQYYTNYFIRHDYCLQYVVKGKGEYFANNKLYFLTKGALFLLPKNKYHYYRANPEDPYEYFWIHFNGSGFERFLRLINLSEDSPVLFDLENPNIAQRFTELIEICKTQSDGRQNLLILSKCYALLFEIASATREIKKEPVPPANTFVEQAINYITEHYTEKTTLEDLQKVTHINKCYLSALFKKTTGLSPIQYLIQYRISQACRLLSTNVSVSEICYLCGFQEPTNFFVRFKQFMGCTPSQYRESLKSVLPKESHTEEKATKTVQNEAQKEHKKRTKSTRKQI